MIKTEVDMRTRSLEFPKLRSGKNDNIIVLFSAPTKGTVVALTGPSCYELGHFSANWATHVFEDFNGSVKLTNVL